MPEFVIGTLLIVLFATNVVPRPPGHRADPAGRTRHGRTWKGLVLPVATLTLAVVPYVARVMRASTIEVLESDYVEMARLKGIPERTVLWRHALPNAVGPTFQVIALNVAYLVGGVVVVETLFNYTGIGVALVDAVREANLPVVQFLAMLIAAIYVVTNLLADVGTILVTPPAADEADVTESSDDRILPADVRRPSARSPIARQLSAGRALRLWRTRIGLGLSWSLLVGVAVFGPLFAPTARPSSSARRTCATSTGTLLGTDYFGQDVLSRDSCTAATPSSCSPSSRPRSRCCSGVTIGLVAAYSRGRLDDVLMRLMDINLAFPQLLLALVALTTIGPKSWVIVLDRRPSPTMPRIARVTRGAAVPVVERDFISAAEALGESRFRILRSEMLPNVSGPAARRGQPAAHLLASSSSPRSASWASPPSSTPPTGA